MIVSEIKYERYTVEKSKAEYEKVINQIKNAESAKEVVKVRAAFVEEEKKMDTAESIAYMRWSANTKDEFYKNEKEYYDQNLPLLQGVRIEYIKAMLGTPFRKKVEKELPETLYPGYELELKSLDERIIPDLQEEADTVMQYSDFMSEFTVDFKGQKLPLTILKKYMSDKDRDTRRDAFNALGEVFSQNKEFLDGNFDKLVKTRDRMAKKMSYKNYVELGYYMRNRIGYGIEDVAEFRKNILLNVVPLVTRMRRERAKKMGITEMKLYDYDVFFKEGDPEPILDAEGIFKAGKEMYHEMNSETGKFIDMMIENEAFDYVSREGKWGGGYEIDFPSYGQPFILANFNGSSADVDVLTHEAGHAFASYLTSNCGVDAEVNIGGMETAETHSMSMEFFCWKYIDKFFGARANDYKYRHLLDNLTFLTYGVIVDYFQQLVYENPEMTPGERDEVWLKLEKEFRPYMNADGINYFEKGTRWQYQMHIYEEPFYYIDYCLAQATALQFLNASQKNYCKAFKAYYNLVKQGGSKPYAKLVEEAGLVSPFEKDSLKEVAENAEIILNKLISD